MSQIPDGIVLSQSAKTTEMFLDFNYLELDETDKRVDNDEECKQEYEPPIKKMISPPEFHHIIKKKTVQGTCQGCKVKTYMH